MELDDGRLTVRASDFAAFTARRWRSSPATPGCPLLEVRPTDESLESVFAYLVPPMIRVIAGLDASAPSPAGGGCSSCSLLVRAADPRRPCWPVLPGG